jgi:peptide/nickel transport system substrate-binding protein
VNTLLALALLALPATGETVVVGVLADPVSLQPHRATDLVSEAIVANVCDTLVRFRPGGGHAEAGLALTWATPDNRTWTFTLRHGVRFHDGTEFDADAVVANVESLRRQRAFPGRAERVGRHVVAISLEQPAAALLATLSQPFFAMQSPQALAADDPRPVGTGPFRVAEVTPGAVTLLANPEYWGGAPRAERVVFRRFPSEAGLVEALRSGEVDVTSAIGQDYIATLEADPHVRLDSQTGLNIAFLSINNQRPPWNDPRVRQAAARAIDRDALVRELLRGQGQPARNPIPPRLWGYSERTRALFLDRPAARRLLSEAGLAAGFETTLLSVDSPRPPYMPDPLRLAQHLMDDLAAVGIRCRLTTAASWAEYVGRGQRGDYDLMPLGWQADTADPNDFLSALLGTPAIGTTNRSRYSSPSMDVLLKRGQMAADVEGRASAYREAQALFQRDMPFVPLYHASLSTARRHLLRGLSLGPTGLLHLERATKAEP